MSREFGTSAAQSLKAEALLQKITVFRHGLQTETDTALRQRVKRLCAQAEVELTHLEVEAAAPAEITAAEWPAPRAAL